MRKENSVSTWSWWVLTPTSAAASHFPRSSYGTQPSWKNTARSSVPVSAAASRAASVALRTPATGWRVPRKTRRRFGWSGSTRATARTSTSGSNHS